MFIKLQMQDLKTFVQKAMKEMKENNYKKALDQLEILLLKQSGHYQGILLSVKCHIELNQLEKAKRLIEEAQRRFPGDFNIKMAALTIAKKENADEGCLFENYMEIAKLFVEKKEAKKSLDILKNIYQLSLEDLFEQNKESIMKLSQEILDLLENKEDYILVSQYISKQYALNKIDDLEFLELLDKYPTKIEANDKVKEKLEEKNLEKMENSLDKKDMKLQLLAKNQKSDTLRLYLIKYGVFDLSEMSQYISDIQTPKTHKQKILAYLVDYIQGIIKDQDLGFQIQFLETQQEQYEIEDEAFQFMEFILKIKEFFDEQESFSSIIVYFQNNFKIYDLPWLRCVMSYHLFQNHNLVDRQTSFMNQILNGFLILEQSDWGKAFFILIAKFHNMIFKIKNIQIEEDKFHFQDEIVANLVDQNLIKISFEKLQELEQSFIEGVEKRPEFFYLQKYIQFMLLQKAVDKGDLAKMKQYLLPWKTNEFILQESIKVKFILGEDLQECFQYLKERKLMNYLLRRKENFQIYYHVQCPSFDLNQKIELFSDFFSFQQDQKWFLAMLSPLLFQYRDFSNCFSVTRRLYDTIEAHLLKRVEEKQAPKRQSQQYFYLREKGYKIMTISQEKLSSMNALYKDSFLESNQNFQNHFINQLLTICKITQKYTLCQKIIVDLQESGFLYNYIGQHRIEDEELVKKFYQVISHLSQHSSQSLEGNLDLIIEDMDLLGEMNSYQKLKMKLFEVSQYCDKSFYACGPFLNPVLKLISNYVATQPDNIPKLKEDFEGFLEQLTEYLSSEQDKKIVQALPYLIRMGLTLQIELSPKFIQQVLKLESNFKSFQFDQFLLDKNSSKLVNVDQVASQFKRIYFQEEVDADLLFYSFNAEKENLLIWLLLARYLLAKKMWEIAEQTLLKVQYLLKENENELYLDYFNLLILQLKQSRHVSRELLVEQKFVQKFRKITFQEKIQNFQEESLEEEIKLNWIELNLYQLLKLAKIWILLKIQKGKHDEAIDQLLEVRNYIQSRKGELTFKVIQTLPSLEDFDLHLFFDKIYQTLKQRCPNSKKMVDLQALHLLIMANKDWRALISKIIQEAATPSANSLGESKLEQKRRLLNDCSNYIENLNLKQNNTFSNILKTVNGLRRKDKVSSMLKMKFLILKEPQLKAKFGDQFNQITFSSSQDENYEQVGELMSNYQRSQKLLQKEGFLAGKEVWKVNGRMTDALMVSLQNCLFLEQSRKDNLPREKQAQLVNLIIQDINLEKNLVLPVLRHLYLNEQYEQFEQLLFKMDSFKMTKNLENYLNFYVLLYKIKSYELSEEVTEEDEFEIEELYNYFMEEECSAELRNSAKYIYSLYGLLVKKEKNVLSNLTLMKFAVLGNPQLMSNAKKFLDGNEIITFQ